MEKGCPKVKSGVKYMIPGAKVKNHDVLAHEWFLNFMPRPNMSIKEERKRLDMRILGRIVGVRSAKQSVGIIVGGFCSQHLIIFIKLLALYLKEC